MRYRFLNGQVCIHASTHDGCEYNGFLACGFLPVAHYEPNLRFPFGKCIAKSRLDTGNVNGSYSNIQKLVSSE